MPIPDHTLPSRPFTGPGYDLVCKILEGEAVSDTIGPNAFKIVGIRHASDWATDHRLSFLISADGEAWTEAGTTQGWAWMESGDVRRLTPQDDAPYQFSGARYFKVRAGTSGAPLTQAADRWFHLELGPKDPEIATAGAVA